MCPLYLYPWVRFKSILLCSEASYRGDVVSGGRRLRTRTGSVVLVGKNLADLSSGRSLSKPQRRPPYVFSYRCATLALFTSTPLILSSFRFSHSHNHSLEEEVGSQVLFMVRCFGAGLFLRDDNIGFLDIRHIFRFLHVAGRLKKLPDEVLHKTNMHSLNVILRFPSRIRPTKLNVRQQRQYLD